MYAFAGLRLGEAAGLRLADVDFLRRTVSVCRQLQGENSATTQPVAPKFGPERVVYTPAELMALLAKHVSEQVSSEGTGCSRTRANL